MLRIPGLGPKKVRAIHESLEIDTLDKLDKLRLAYESGRVAKLKGFGAKTQEKILEGLKFVSEVGNRVRLDQAIHYLRRASSCLLLRFHHCPQFNRVVSTPRGQHLAVRSKLH